MEISVSFLKSKYPIDEQIEILNKSNCDLIHVDFMDGTFVDNKSLTLEDMHLEKFTKPVPALIVVLAVLIVTLVVLVELYNY